MSTKKKIVISMIAILTLVFGGVMVIHADGDTPSSQDLLSSGRIEVDLNSDNTIDAIFDAQDLKDIATSVENGKSSLATSINAYPNTNVGTLDTFANLSSAIDTITEIPDVYYYDKATEGVDCARYIYENGSYYPCDKYGVKTSDTALTGTITVVTKDDTTEPAAGEIQLVKYEKTGDANLSAGFAGYADKSFVLGSGADNITYRSLGKDIVIENVINNYFSGNTIVVDDTTHGPGYKDTCLLANIDPAIFSEVKYWAACWGGSATGNYPNSTYHGVLEIWLQDDLTGEIRANGTYSGTGFTAVAPNNSITIDETWENTVSLYYTSEWWKTSGDATGTASIGNIQLTIR